MNAALKEWACVVDALGAGLQIMLLRKGGIVEAERDGFKLRHEEFLLFPTWEHQHSDMIREEFRARYAPYQDPYEGKSVPITLLAHVTDILSAPPAATLRDAQESYIWNGMFLDKRYTYRPDLPLYILLLRVYRLANPALIPNRPSYAGCKSWVNLTEEIGTGNAEPVLPQNRFNEMRENLRMKLCASSL